MSDPAVSVVVPTYNSPHYLREALESVFRQTFADYEVVVINDGSTDDTLRQLEPLQQQHGDRLRVITQVNGGVGVARNRGIDEARGKYSAFMDHDDWWMPAKLQEQVRFLDAHPSCVGCVVPYASSTTPTEPMFDAAQITDGDGVIRRPLQAMAEGQVLFGTCSVLMVDRQRTQGLRFGTVRGAIEDVPYQVNLLSRGQLGVAGVDLLAVWRRHETNFSNQASYFANGNRLLRELQRQGAFASLPVEHQRDLSDYLAQQGRVAAMRQLPGDHAQAIAVYRRELRHQLRQGRWKFILGFPALWATSFLKAR